MTSLTFHPLANVFPLREGEEFDAFVADIEASGLCEAIWPRSTLQHALAVSSPAPQRLGRCLPHAHDGCFPGALRQSAVVGGQKIALRSGGAHTACFL